MSSFSVNDWEIKIDKSLKKNLPEIVKNLKLKKKIKTQSIETCPKIS
jgi:hypothetical protein